MNDSRVVHSFRKDLLLHHSVTERKKEKIFLTNGGRRFDLDVSRSDTLQEIKLKIHSDYRVPVSAQTLSFNGIIIANNTDLINARLADGSVIRLDVADEAPIGPPTRAVSDQASSSERPPHGRKRGRAIRLRLPQPHHAVDYDATDGDTVLQLKEWIQDNSDVPIDEILIRDQSGNELPDAMPLLLSQIRDNPEQAVEFLQPAPLPQFPLTVILKHGNASVPVTVLYGVQAVLLREILHEIDVSHVLGDLPNSYYFSHNQVPIQENLTLLSQNIPNGAIVEILPGHQPFNMDLKLETNIPHQKAFFDVQAHSDETIQQLKEKIAINEGIPVDRILIKKKGIELPDHSTLHACSITSDYKVKVEILQ